MFALLTAFAVSAAALTGSEFAAKARELDLNAREAEVLRAFDEGHVPAFSRKFVPVKLGDVEIEVAPDYFAIGTDDDFLLMPVTPATARKIAERLDSVLPTRKMVDAIYAAAEVKLDPAPIPPSDKMTTVAAFADHNAIVAKQRAAADARLGALVAGHKKDIVDTPRLAGAPGKVAIYGWHRRDGKAIQPLYLGHTEAWVDYSHGARFVKNAARLNGKATTVREILASAAHAHLLSDEAPKSNALRFEPGIRAVIDEPPLATNMPTLLILYALPNGNTIEQTQGRRIREGESFRFNIQHIAAQTRWLRTAVTNRNIVVAYLECEGLSWPAWRRKHGDRPIVEAATSLRARVGEPSKLVLTGHSGGGSFTFGFIDAVDAIPDFVERIAFLDSNYAYETRHAAKLSAWLEASTNRALCVLAYKDFIARLDGKPFVSENGGTWGRSLAMLNDLGKAFAFRAASNPPFQTHSALGRRIQFHLHENPHAKILHTIQVERNGFIHAILAATDLENSAYEYFGDRVYTGLIEDR